MSQGYSKRLIHLNGLFAYIRLIFIALQSSETVLDEMQH